MIQTQQVHTILLVDDELSNLQILHTVLEPLGHKLLIARGGSMALNIAHNARPSVVLLDVMMPGMNGFQICEALKAKESTREISVIFITALDNLADKVKGFQMGAVDFISKPFQAEEVQARVSTQIQIQSQKRQLKLELQVAQELLKEAQTRVEGSLLGESEAVKYLHSSMNRLAKTDRSILLTGPPGSGYEAVARNIHQQSSRVNGTFFHINCSALQENQSTAFLTSTEEVHELGHRHRGKLALADGGTVFLERIEGLSLPLQQRLLTFLMEMEQQREQGQTPSPDVRFISYASKDLHQEAVQGTFLQPLLALLLQERLTVPSLAERKEDIAVLARHFLIQHSQKLGKIVDTISNDSLQHLMQYSWPGNIDELRNLIERQVAVESGSVLVIDTSQLEEGVSMGGYRLLNKIGQGGMGEVWSAKHQLLTRPAAIKILRPAFNSDTMSKQNNLLRFQKEARVTAHLRSPYTVDLYDFGVDESGAFYYVMEHLHGMDLLNLIEKHGPLPVERMIYLLRPICRSLEEAHGHSLIHRDIKPENIFVSRLGPVYDFPKILDFGIVKGKLNSEDVRLTMDENIIIGTPGFIAPEAIQGGQSKITPAFDIYSMGCVMYYVITGREVFPLEDNNVMQSMLAHITAIPEPPSTYTPRPIPEELDQLILHCLQKKPLDRPASIHELWQRLGEIPMKEVWTPEKAHQWWKTNEPELAAPSNTFDVSPSSNTISNPLTSQTTTSLKKKALPK